MKQLKNQILIITMGAVSLLMGNFSWGELFAAVPARLKSEPQFYTDISLFKSSLTVPLMTRTKKIELSDKMIHTRMEEYLKDGRVEPIQLTVDPTEEKLLELAGLIAQKNKKLELANYLKSNFLKGEEIPGTNLRLVTLDKSALFLVHESALEDLFAKQHAQLFVPTVALKKNLKIKEEFMGQIAPFLSQMELQQVQKKLDLGLPLSMDKDILPQAVRRRVGHHTKYKGPNCFHAALMFQNETLATSRAINVRKEPGYHTEMINYDELWRVLQLSFYEVSPLKSPLQYGDMIVFFEISEAGKSGIDYRTLRHAATYLFGGYVYSKGSKSANSPYLIKTLDEEWNIWTKYTNRLGVKVFRRSQKHVTNRAPVDPVDWVY